MAGFMTRVSLLAACAALLWQLGTGAHPERALVVAGLMAGAVHVAQLVLFAAARLAAHAPRGASGDAQTASGHIDPLAPADTAAAPAGLAAAPAQSVA